jgi:putative oxidoreductase
MTSVDPAETSSSASATHSGVMGKIIGLRSLYMTVINTLERATSLWLPGALARFVFVAVLFGYYWNSALTKIDGSIFSLTIGAYAQIVPPVIEAAGYDVSQVSFLATLLVYAGTWGEFLLPILLVIGLFTRFAALGMIVFVIVQSYVDITYHGLTAEFIGSWFDRFQDAIIYDQRTLWVFPLIYLVLKGPGLLSVDALFGRVFKRG